MQSKCAVCGTKKSRFLKKEEAKGLSNLGIKKPLNKIQLLGDVLFWVYKMNDIVNKILLAGDKFMSEIHLKQLGFTYSDCGPFTKNKKKLRNLWGLERQTLFTKMILIKLVFNMIRLMVNQNI